MTQKTLLISRTLGIEGRKLLTPEDDFDALREFNHAYEGARSTVEEMHLEYQDLLQDGPSSRRISSACPARLQWPRAMGQRRERRVFLLWRFPPSTRRPASSRKKPE